MIPEEVLQKELVKYQSALNHLQIALDTDKILEGVYNERKGNLLPLIQQFKDAIHCLKIFGK